MEVIRNDVEKSIKILRPSTIHLVPVLRPGVFFNAFFRHFAANVEKILYLDTLNSLIFLYLPERYKIFATLGDAAT